MNNNNQTKYIKDFYEEEPFIEEEINRLRKEDLPGYVVDKIKTNILNYEELIEIANCSYDKSLATFKDSLHCELNTHIINCIKCDILCVLIKKEELLKDNSIPEISDKTKQIIENDNGLSYLHYDKLLTDFELNIEDEFEENYEDPEEAFYTKDHFTQEEKELRALEDIKLPYYVASKIKTHHLDYEELVSIANYGYTKALNSFDKSRNVKFATYAVNCMRNEIFYILRKERKHTDNNTSFHRVLATDKNGNELELSDLIGDNTRLNENISVEDSILAKETNDLLFRALSYLRKQEQIVIMYRYGLNNYPKKTQKEVANLIGMSQANVSKMEKSCLLKLKLFLKKDMTEM